MTFTHYSSIQFEFRRDYHYMHSGAFKPAGFWISVDGEDSWKDWCINENFGMEGDVIVGLTHAYDVKLRTDRILFIRSVQELDDFHSAYSVIRYGSLQDIDWGRVQAEWDGIVIAPYCWERRMDFPWYYGWDCASGVIWNLSAIESVTLRKSITISVNTNDEVSS